MRGTRSATQRGYAAVHKVAKRLNEHTDLSLPWTTDGKHCRDRFKLLLDKWEVADKRKALESRGSEEFGSYDKLCNDICEQMNAKK